MLFLSRLVQIWPCNYNFVTEPSTGYITTTITSDFSSHIANMLTEIGHKLFTVRHIAKISAIFDMRNTL